MKTQRSNEEVLEAVAACLEEQGWCQGVLVDWQGRHCLLGAMEAVRLAHLEWMACCHAIQAEIGGNPITWNDTPGRTQDEVVTTIRNAKRHVS